MNKISIICVILCATFCFVLIVDRKRLTESRDKYKENTETLLTNIRQYKIDSTKNVVEASRLQLTVSEFKKYRADDIKMIKELGLQVKQIKASMNHQLDVDVPISTPIHDTTIVRYNTPLLVKRFNLSDEYRTFKGIIDQDSIKGNLSLNVTLKQFIYIVYKHKLLWIRWGVKGVNQVVVSNNPYVKLNYSEFIEIKK